MIVSLRTTNIFNVLDTIGPITAVVEVFSGKPAEEYTPDSSYLYLSKVTDNTTSATDSCISWWSLIKTAIITFNIVAWLNESKNDTDVLYDIVDVINEQIVDEWQNKINTWDGVRMKKVTESSPAPIGYNVKNRAVLVKQYLFTYYAK